MRCSMAELNTPSAKRVVLVSAFVLIAVVLACVLGPQAVLMWRTRDARVISIDRPAQRIDGIDSSVSYREAIVENGTQIRELYPVFDDSDAAIRSARSNAAIRKVRSRYGLQDLSPSSVEAYQQALDRASWQDHALDPADPETRSAISFCRVWLDAQKNNEMRTPAGIAHELDVYHHRAPTSNTASDPNA